MYQEIKEGPGLFKSIIRSRVLLRRICTTPIWWITTTFVYYGLNINATGLSGNMYLNFIFTVLVEIPGFYTAVLILDRIGRKPTLASGFIFSASCNIAFVFIRDGLLIFLYLYTLKLFIADIITIIHAAFSVDVEKVHVGVK